MGGGEIMYQGENEEYLYFQCKLKQLTGIDLKDYKANQMKRRLKRYLLKERVPNFLLLARLIEKDPLSLYRLKDYLTINVTEFFRNPIRFDELQKQVLPELKRKFRDLRLWSAGCSNGAEAYTLSILIEEFNPKGDHQILATDIDRSALQEALIGVYGEDKIKEVTQARKERFFNKVDEGWQITSQVKRRVQFKNHNLLFDPYPSKMHLILCRNVLIYFTDEAKEEVYQKFVQALEIGGYLMTGATESILHAKKYGLQSAGPFLYRRTGVIC